jgi:iron complex transport system ATP-binding protein
MKDAGIYSYGGIETVTAKAISDVYGMEAEIIEHRGNKLIVPL